MKNVTITLDEETAQWARVEAAKAGKSLSRWISEKIENEMQAPSPSASEAEAALARLERFFKGPGYPGIAAGFDREALYDRPALRRHEHPDLYARPRRRGKAGNSN